MNNPAITFDDPSISAAVTERFLRYVRCWTTSDSREKNIPTTEGQWELAKALVQELRDLGLSDVELTDRCFVIGRLPATAGKENARVIGLLAHIDTAEGVSGKDVQPQLVKSYDGKKICLSGGGELDPATDPDLAAHKGKTIIHTDGTTLLGADDKAGIAEIISAVEHLLARPEIAHGPVEIIFSPDEETGMGMAAFPKDKVRAEACYTLDGGPMGELEVECFTAYKAKVSFAGKAIHPGYARGVLANAASMAAAFASMLPRSESPEATDGYYGYYNLTEIHGDHESAGLEVLIRDFEDTGAQRRIEALECFARAVEAQFPGGAVKVESQVQYYNMKQKIDERPLVLEKLKEASASLGIECYLKPIRGGTDGSRLTEMGIPTPNIFTGGRKWHSRMEWASVPEMAAASALVIELIRLWGV